MSARFDRLTIIVVSVLIPLAGACKPETPRSITDSAGASTPATATESVKPVAVATIDPAPAAAVSADYEDGETAYREGRYGDAVAIFTAYTERRPENAWGQYMLGLSAWKEGQHEEAVAAFDSALAIDPKHQKSLLNSSRVLLDLDRPEDALERIEVALGEDSTSAESWRLLGRARTELNQPDDAIEAYRRAIALDERDGWAMNNLGLVYIQQGRYEDALGPLARAVQLRGNAPVFQNNLGTALERTGHITAARAAYEAALAADSTYTKASVALARVKEFTEDPSAEPFDLADTAQRFVLTVRMGRETEAVVEE